MGWCIECGSTCIRASPSISLFLSPTNKRTQTRKIDRPTNQPSIAPSHTHTNQLPKQSVSTCDRLPRPPLAGGRAAHHVADGGQVAAAGGGGEVGEEGGEVLLFGWLMSGGGEGRGR